MKRSIIITLLVAALLFVLAGIAAVVFFTVRQEHFFRDGNQLFATLEETKSIKVDAKSPVKLKVIDDAGRVTVVGADVKTMEVKAVKTAYASTQAEADEKVKTIKYNIEQTGNTITISYKVPKTTILDIDLNMVDFTVTVPNETRVNIDNRLGAASVSNVKGDTAIVNEFGEVTVDHIQGGLSVSTNNGEVNTSAIEAGSKDIDLNSEFGSITLKNANGKDIRLVSNNGTITLEEVRATSEITAQTDFGNTTFENGSSDSLHIKTNNGAVSVIKVRVGKEIKVEDEFGEIKLDQAFTPSYDLQTNGGSVTVDGAKGKLKAHTAFGGIKIQNGKAVTLDLDTKNGTVDFAGSLGVGPHMVNSEFGEIDLTLPADSKLSVDLKTEFGNITSDLPVTVTVTETSNSNSNQLVGSINGGGEQLSVQTNSGSVNIHASQ